MFARRAGNSWFIAGINGMGAPAATALDLAAFQEFPHRVAVVEGPNAQMQVSATPLEAAAEWRHELPARGGFILRLDR